MTFAAWTVTEFSRRINKFMYAHILFYEIFINKNNNLGFSWKTPSNYLYKSIYAYTCVYLEWYKYEFYDPEIDYVKVICVKIFTYFCVGVILIGI